MPRTRRRALRSLAAVVTVGLAGCTGTDAQGNEETGSPSTTTTETSTARSDAPRATGRRPGAPTETPRPTATASPTPRAPDALAVEELDSASRSVPDALDTTDVASTPFLALSVGERSQVQSEHRKPHQVWVWNDADEAHDLTLTLSNARGTIVERTVSFEANSKLVVVLQVPSAYEFTVAVKGEGAGEIDASETVEIPFSQFDCNDSATDVVVRDDGSIESSSVTTEMACTALTPGLD
ncbi:hypothetical protein [Halogranum rubrum]|uniref:Uncharacterized protein n=1 Tax=Halogranum salarium B-1 TaxID=1210908 RepID=J3ESR3_9EURY|nr:hypothetical protein [Halogranum salarium]EJN57022.1 hypothetical protein HSB1_44080 [Halogranum salarium B-1]